MDNKIIGENIKKYRKEKKMTQKELSEKINKHKITLARYEKGNITIPIDVLNVIAVTLNVPINKLIGNEIKSKGEIFNSWRDDIVKYNISILELENFINCIKGKSTINI